MVKFVSITEINGRPVAIDENGQAWWKKDDDITSELGWNKVVHPELQFA